MMSGGYDGKIAGLYDLEETLGRGHYAVVKLARHVFTGERVAVKVRGGWRGGEKDWVRGGRWGEKEGG